MADKNWQRFSQAANDLKQLQAKADEMLYLDCSVQMVANLLKMAKINHILE